MAGSLGFRRQYRIPKGKASAGYRFADHSRSGGKALRRADRCGPSLAANAFWNSFGSASAMALTLAILPRRLRARPTPSGRSRLRVRPTTWSHCPSRARPSTERRQSNERPEADGRCDPIGRDRFIACRTVRSSVALSAKTSAKAPWCPTGGEITGLWY